MFEGIIKKIRAIFGPKEKLTEKSSYETIYEEIEKEEKEEIHSLWNYFKISENSQAAHLSAVVGFYEWITMEDIRNKIKEFFGIEYKNERSLYPYIKTFVDLGLFETTDIGGRRKWRKKEVIIRTKSKKEDNEMGKELALLQKRVQ